jgi:hypothetical protein
MPPLSAELFGINSKERMNESLDNQNELINQEFMGIKEAIK